MGQVSTFFGALFGKRGHCKGPNQMNFRRGGYQPTNQCPSNIP